MTTIFPIELPENAKDIEWHKEVARLFSYLTYAGSPLGSLTPRKVGDRCLDTTNNDWYVSFGTTSSEWEGQKIIGDYPTDYAKFEDDGELILYGNARVEQEFTINAVNLDRGNQGPDAVILGNTIGYSYDIGDDSVMNFEIPYGCDTSEYIKIEIYWYINEARTGANEQVQWRGQWSACPNDESEAIDAPTHTGTIDFGDQLIPATAKHLTEVSGLIPAASISDGDFVSITIDRVALDGGADPTADPVIVQIEVEYTANKIGKAI